VAPIGAQIRRNDRTLAKVPEYRRAVVASSAAISALAVAFAAIIAARATTALSGSPLFILCVVIAVVAGAILLVAGIPDFAGWLRGTEREEPAYWATVRVIRQRTGALNGQRQTRAVIAWFATGTEKYRWLAGEVWAGKTTLLAEAALQLRGNVDVIAYFASRREGDADSSRFLAATVPQLAWLIHEVPPAPVREEFRALWRRVTERAAAKDRHVLLVVDGLDEDLHPPELPSIAAELPAVAGTHAHVLVSSRSGYQLPADVPPGHLLAFTDPEEVAPFAGARDLAALARQEIDDLLRRDNSDGLAADVLGLFTAAAGPLTIGDLAVMTSVAGPAAALRQRIHTLLNTAAARSLQRARTAGSSRYQFAHESLLAYAQAHESLNDPDFRRRIHQWADRWRDAGCPAPSGREEATPQYLLDAYPSTLVHDPERLSALTGDVAWIEAVITVMGIDRALAELRRAAAANPGSTVLAAMLAAVTGQVLNLRPPHPLDEPGYILRQLWMQAAELGGDGMAAAERLASEIRQRLQSLPGPNLVPCWTTRKTSQALSRELGRHDSFIRAMEVLADGKLAVADDHRVLIWDPASSAASPIELGDRAEAAEVIVADGRVITAQADGRPLIRDPAGAKTAPAEFGGRVIPGSRSQTPLESVLPDGRTVKSTLPSTLLVNEPDAGCWRGREMSCAVTALAALPDGRAVVGMQDGSVGIWDAGTMGAWPAEIGRHDDQVSAIAVLPDGLIATGSYDRRILLWNADTDMQDRPPGRLAGGVDHVSAVRMTHNRQLITATDKSVIIWDWDSHGPRAVEKTFIDGYAHSLALLPDQRIAIAGPWNMVQVWDPACPLRDSSRGIQPVVELGHIHGDHVVAVAVLPDGRVVTGGYDGCVLLWDPDHPGSRTSLGLTGGQRIYVLAMLQDGRVASNGSDGRVLIWDPAQPHAGPVVIGRHDSQVRAMAALPDGRIATGGWDDGRVLMWDPNRPNSKPAELGRHNDHVLAAAVLPGGRLVTSGSDRRVLVWQPAKPGAPVFQLSCQAPRLSTTSHGQARSDLVIVHQGNGFSLWSVTDDLAGSPCCE
jgi:WD40 repeat protein